MTEDHTEGAQTPGNYDVHAPTTTQPLVLDAKAETHQKPLSTMWQRIVQGLNAEPVWRVLSAGTLVVALAVLLLTAFSLRSLGLSEPAWMSYADVYRLVPATVSQSAYIPIALPDGVENVTPDQVTITPELKGSLTLSQTSPYHVLYKPTEPLVLGSYYTVSLEQGETVVQADFQVAEDPRVVSILPTDTEETHEDVKISVIFNRPMVPLTTRTELDKQSVPVTLSPDVPGTWKWQSTRLLQFVPEGTLMPATKYTVTVNEGFRSQDGVPVEGFTHSFTTRTLKLQPLPESVQFDEPLTLTFNQPVDLARTAETIVLTRNGEEIEPLVSYGAKKKDEPRGFLGLVLFGSDEDVDTSTVLVRPRSDSHGREGLWDFDAYYTLTIAEKAPLQGTLTDTSSTFWSYTMPPVLQDFTATSERSSHVTPEFFDLQGELVATFFEPVDIDTTRVAVHGLRDVRYGEHCKEDGNGRTKKDPTTGECVKENNKHELRIRINQDALGFGEGVTLSFEQVFNEDGLLLNTEPITRTVRTVPELAVLRTSPASGEVGASLTDLVICSNVPLQKPESIRAMLRTDGYIVFPNYAWENSFRVEETWGNTNICKQGEFRTGIRYGLHPEQPYTVSLSLEDQFGTKTDVGLQFTTGPTPEQYTRFHSLQKLYNVTTPGKTRLTYAVENLPSAIAHVCKMSPETMLRILEEDTLTNGIPPASWCTEVRTAVIDVPDTYWVNNYFYFDIKEYFADPRGHYLITFTHPQYRNDRGVQQYEHTLLSVSNILLGEKRLEWFTYEEDLSRERPDSVAHNLYWAVRADTLEPVAGATVTTYVDTDARWEEARIAQDGSGTTGADGVVRIPARPRVSGATIAHGGDTALVSKNTDTIEREWSQNGDMRTYLYTDRPIYRPGDTVYLRGIDRVGYDNVWSITEGYALNVQVYTSRGDVVYEQKLPVSLYGTLQATIELPKDAPLGTYNIQSESGWGYFDVEEYVGAPFEVTVSPREEEYVAGDTAKFDIRSRYYFDMPLQNATVEYTVLAQDYYFDRYTDEYFSFGAGWYSCYWCGYGDEFITRGTVTLDDEGSASIEVPLSFTEYFDDADKEGSKLFTVIARVSDSSGRQVTGQNTAIVHRGEYYLGVKTDPYFSGKNQPVSIRVKSVDTQGKPLRLNAVTLTISKVEWESYKRREVDGGYYWHSEEKKTPVLTTQLDTDGNGNGTYSYSFTDTGTYAIDVEKTDGKGNVVVGATRMYVWGEGDVSVRPTNNETLSVLADKPSYNPGDTATILVQSPFARGRALITVERGDIYEYWTLPVTSSLITQPIAMRARYAPNVFASVLLLGAGPEVKYGSVELRTGTDEFGLTIEAKPEKDTYLPGEEVVLNVSATDHTGAPVSAEVSVAVVDLSVLALKGNPKKDPVSFFYGTLPLGISTGHSAKNMLVQEDIPVGTKGGGGGEDLSRRKRGTFKDTAYWQASVVTDAEGKATVRFTLPDNLTTWQVESLGVTQDTKLGVSYTEFVSKKRLMTIPLKPRFVVPGDTLWLGMQVANNTGKDMTVRTHIETPTLKLIDAEEKTVKVGAGEQRVVYFAAEAPRDRIEGMHVATFFALHDDAEDVVEQSIPILTEKAFEVTATAGMTKGSSINESVYIPAYALRGEGELTVRVQPTLVASLMGAVRDMAGYPYGCSEQIASRLASLSTMKRVENLFGAQATTAVQTLVFETQEYTIDEAMTAGLAQLLARQTYEGGFSFYAGTEASLYLTVEVLNALTVIRDAGYAVDDSVFQKAAQYVVRKFNESTYGTASEDDVARVAFALSSPYVSDSLRVSVAPRVTAIANNKLVLERLSSTALGYLALATHHGAYPEAIADTFFSALENRLVIDARGAYVASAKNSEYSWFESPAKNTALLLRNIAERGGEHATLDNLLRWLRRDMREGTGWGSTNATFTVLDAALRLAKARGEGTAAYQLVLKNDGTEAARYDVTPNTVFDSFTHLFPIESFERDQLHRITIEKDNDAGQGTMYYDMILRYALPPDLLPPRDEGITVERELRAHGENTVTETARVGDLVTGTLTITIPEEYRAVSVESFIPAGFEILNFSLATEASRDLEVQDKDSYEDPYGYNDGYDSGYSWDWYDPKPGPRPFPVTYEEVHDDRVFLFAEYVSPGTYTYEYTLRALIPGTYRHLPATVQEMYTPEIFGRTNGETFTIEER